MNLLSVKGLSFGNSYYICNLITYAKMGFFFRIVAIFPVIFCIFDQSGAY